MKKALVFTKMTPRHRQEIIQLLGGRYEIEFPESPPTAELLKGAEIIVGNPKPELIKELTELKWIQLQSSGAEPYVQPGVLPKGAVLTCATGAFGPAIAEYMLGYVLTLFKHLHIYRDQQFGGEWEEHGGVRRIMGSAVLIVGMGNIGTEFAWRMKALGARIIGVTRTVKPVPDCADEMHTVSELDSLLPAADIVALSLPSTGETNGMFDAQRLAKMKDGAIIVNVGRGGAIDTDALSDALSSGKLGGAALDVTNPEPLPKEHPLWRQKNVIITPHVTGFPGLEAVEYTQETICDLVVDNISRFLRGQEMQNVVDSSGYRRI